MSSFVHELPLKTNPHDKKILNQALEMASFLYNATISEGLKRIKLIKDSKVYKESKKSKDFLSYNKARKLYKFSDYELQKFSFEQKTFA